MACNLYLFSPYAELVLKTSSILVACRKFLLERILRRNSARLTKLGRHEYFEVTRANTLETGEFHLFVSESFKDFDISLKMITFPQLKQHYAIVNGIVCYIRLVSQEGKFIAICSVPSEIWLGKSA